MAGDPGRAAPQTQTSETEHHAVDSSHAAAPGSQNVTFTSKGAIPPVAAGGAAGTTHQPSASDQAFGDHHDAKEKKKPKPSGFSKSGGGTVRDALTRLANAGKLKINAHQIAQLDALAQVETGGQVASVDTTDDMVVSIGFHQVVLGHKSVEWVIKKAPAAFAKHGIELDMSKTYPVKGWSHPHQIKGVEDPDDLRGHEWGDRFYAASLEDEVIAAIAEWALKEAKEVEAKTTHAGGAGSFWEDDTAKTWLLEVDNNREAYTSPVVKRAVALGANGAKDREAFLDILSKAIVDTYEELEPKLVGYPALKRKFPHEDDAKLHELAKTKYASIGRTKGTHIVTRISRHLKVPTLDAGATVAAATPAPAAKSAAAPTPVAAEHHDEHHDAPVPPVVAHHEAAPAPVVAHQDPAASQPAHAAPEAQATSPHTFTGPAHLRVTATGLNVRSSPSTHDHHNVIGGLHHGDAIEGLEREGDWIAITYKGQRAYVHGGFVEAIPAQVAPQVAEKPEQVVDAVKHPAPSTHADPQTSQAETHAAPTAEAKHEPAPPKIEAAPKHEPAAEAKHEHTPSKTDAAPAHEPAAEAKHEPAAEAKHEPAPPKAEPAKHAEAKHEHAPSKTEAAAEHEATAAPTHAPAAHADAAVATINEVAIRAEYALILSQVEAGKLTTEKAVEQLIGFDRTMHGGQMSPTGMELLVKLPFDISKYEAAKTQHEAAKAQKEAAHPQPAPTPRHTPDAPIEHSPQANIAPVDPAADQSINSLAASLHSAQVQKVATDLATLATDASPKKRDWHGEYEEKDREKIVADIARIRGDVAAIDKTGLDPTKLGQFFTLVNRRLEELAPYHYQGLNILTIETKTGPGKFDYYSTCNMTSLAMSLELLGKSAANYGGDKKQHLLVAAQHYHGDLVRPAKERGAVKHGDDMSGGWPTLLGLRLPDFLELAAVAEYMTAPTEDEAQRAGAEASKKKIGQDILKRLAGKFGVGMHPTSINWNAGQATKLENVDDTLSNFGEQRHDVEVMERLRATAEQSGKDADKQKYQAAYAKEQSKMHGDVTVHKKKQSIDTALPLDRYRDAVIAQLRPVLDSGAAVMTGAWMHWLRLYSVDEHGVVVQDPGAWDRHEMHVPWEEARAMGYFWTNLVFR